MASTAVDKGAAKNAPEAEINRLRAELDALRKEFEARMSAVEARLPEVETPTVEEQAVPPETLAVIAVAVTAYLGKKVKIRSARQIQRVNPWAQTGRTAIQGSHNLMR